MIYCTECRSVRSVYPTFTLVLSFYFFQEVKPKSNPLKHKILENYALMATKNKSLTEKALASYMELATTEV